MVGFLLAKGNCQCIIVSIATISEHADIGGEKMHCEQLRMLFNFSWFNSPMLAANEK